MRARVQGGLARWLVPSSWRTRLHERFSIGQAESASDAGYDSEEGEELGDVDEGSRLHLESIDARRLGVDDTRRLSRELSVPHTLCRVACPPPLDIGLTG